MTYQHNKWEHIESTYATFRLKVPGGWLYRDKAVSGAETTMCFVPNVTNEGKFEGER